MMHSINFKGLLLSNMFFIDWVWVQTHACRKFGYKQQKKKKKLVILNAHRTKAN